MGERVEPKKKEKIDSQQTKEEEASEEGLDNSEDFSGTLAIHDPLPRFHWGVPVFTPKGDYKKTIVKRPLKKK